MVRTARLTGLFYLGLALTGMLGFLVLRPRLYAAGDPAATLANLTEKPALATALVVFELLIVVTQALAAAWFYRLFRAADPFGAAGVGAFGLINATVILASAAMLSAAVAVADDPFGDAAATVQLLFLISDGLWAVGAVFFGLWLIPMGTSVLRSGLMPAALGWVLIAGGAGYLLSAFVPVEALAFPATIAEFWIIGYLLIFGVRTNGAAEKVRTSEAAEDRSGRLDRDDVQLPAGGDGDVGATAGAQRDPVG